jgi:uncharacterized metal-binding protein
MNEIDKNIHLLVVKDRNKSCFGPKMTTMIILYIGSFLELLYNHIIEVLIYHFSTSICELCHSIPVGEKSMLVNFYIFDIFIHCF